MPSCRAPGREVIPHSCNAAAAAVSIPPLLQATRLSPSVSYRLEEEGGTYIHDQEQLFLLTDDVSPHGPHPHSFTTDMMPHSPKPTPLIRRSGRGDDDGELKDMLSLRQDDVRIEQRHFLVEADVGLVGTRLWPA